MFFIFSFCMFGLTAMATTPLTEQKQETTFEVKQAPEFVNVEINSLEDSFVLDAPAFRIYNEIVIIKNKDLVFDNLYYDKENKANDDFYIKIHSPKIKI